MYAMTELRRNRKRCSGFVIFCFVLTLTGCARRESLYHPEAAAPASEQNLPFHPDPHLASDSDAERPAVPAAPQLSSGMPFRSGAQSRVLAAGTLVTVELDRSLSAAKVHAGDQFAASVAAPLTVDGETLVERGSPVVGSVEIAQVETNGAQAPGYFRLTLDAMTVGGRLISLRTSSLYTRGTIQPNGFSGSSAGVQKGRRLTFRLTAPVAFEDPAISHRQAASIAE